MESPLKNISVLPHEFTGKLDLEKEAQEIDQFLTDELALDTTVQDSPKPDNILGFSDHQLGSSDGHSFEEFSSNYNTTGQYAKRFKKPGQDASEFSKQDFNTSSDATFPENHSAQHNIQNEILTQLQTNNLFIKQLSEKILHNNSQVQGGLPEEIISELKTNNLYLSRVELKISQLLRALERLFNS